MAGTRDPLEERQPTESGDEATPQRDEGERRGRFEDDYFRRRGGTRDAATERYNQLRDQAQEYYNQGREMSARWERAEDEDDQAATELMNAREWLAANNRVFTLHAYALSAARILIAVGAGVLLYTATGNALALIAVATYAVIDYLDIRHLIKSLKPALYEETWWAARGQGSVVPMLGRDFLEMPPAGEAAVYPPKGGGQ